jgi:hypothetical protein
MKSYALPLSLALTLGAQTPKPIFYRDLDYGSESQLSPLASMLTWTFDTLQVPESFDEHDYWSRWKLVKEDLLHPGRAAKSRGGLGAFINRQILPYKMTEPDWIPNYSLHLLGGGMVFRKKAEWFEAHDVPLPYLASAVLTVVEELAQETVEKASTKPDDEVADVLFFLPLSMALYSNDRFAHFAADTLHLSEWPYQAVYDPNARRPWGTRGKLTNVGQNFVVKPEIFGWKEHRPFVFFGLTSLFGVSHKLSATDSLSWGLGAAITHAQDPTRTRFSGGLFWDRNDSLLASVIVNGTDDLALRLNVYPGITGPRAWWSPGFYVGYGTHRDLNVGITLRFLPLGLGKTSPSVVK